jgi:hypothetical protein
MQMTRADRAHQRFVSSQMGGLVMWLSSRGNNGKGLPDNA